MLRSLRSRARGAVTIGIVAALVVAGVAVAQDNGNAGKSAHRGSLSGTRMPPPPGGPMGPFGKDLTYAQIHVQHEGKAEVVRLDSGEVVTAGESSITLKENDGNEVTISVDDETEVLAGPGKTTAVGDLEAGRQVVVSGPEGDAAEAIMLPPKAGQMPPPAGHFGGSQGGPPQMQG